MESLVQWVPRSPHSTPPLLDKSRTRLYVRLPDRHIYTKQAKTDKAKQLQKTNFFQTWHKHIVPKVIANFVVNGY